VLSPLLETDDPEAAAFFADAAASLLASAPAPRRAAHVAVDEPDLSDLTGMPDGPAPEPRLVRHWIGESFDRYFLATARRKANHQAREAARYWSQHKPGSWETVFRHLAAAEEYAPEVDHPWHAARLDAYVAAHGIKGWYRDTCRGKHRVHLNLLRVREDGDRGRYFVHPADRMRGPAQFWVVDRDSGRTAYRAPTDGIARQWIDDMEVA
jgi:hypothetical protein